jgi:hypothetical protein
VAEKAVEPEEKALLGSKAGGKTCIQKNRSQETKNWNCSYSKITKLGPAAAKNEALNEKRPPDLA